MEHQIKLNSFNEATDSRLVTTNGNCQRLINQTQIMTSKMNLSIIQTH